MAAIAFFIILIILALGTLALDNVNLLDYFHDIEIALNTLAIFFVSIGLLGFVYNITRYFIIESGDEEGRTKAKQYALWSIIGFVAVVSIWGLVNLLVESLGVGGPGVPCIDYLPKSHCSEY